MVVRPFGLLTVKICPALIGASRVTVLAKGAEPRFAARPVRASVPAVAMLAAAARMP